MDAATVVGHEVFPSEEQKRYLASRGLHWRQPKQYFGFEFKDRGETIGYTTAGKWRARIKSGGRVARDKRHVQDWLGPEFDDPVACYVAAEFCDWGQS